MKCIISSFLFFLSSDIIKMLTILDNVKREMYSQKTSKYVSFNKFTAYANLLHLPCMKSNNYQGGGLPDILHLYSDKSDLKDVKIQPLTRVMIYEAPYQGGKALSE